MEIRADQVSGQCTNECYYGATEIKFEDMTWTGARICCPGHIKDMGGPIRTTGGLSVVSVYSQKATQGFRISYRAGEHWERVFVVGPKIIGYFVSRADHLV